MFKDVGFYDLVVAAVYCGYALVCLLLNFSRIKNKEYKEATLSLINPVNLFFVICGVFILFYKPAVALIGLIIFSIVFIYILKED